MALALTCRKWHFNRAATRKRKPNPDFYKEVIQVTGVDPTRVAFVDEKVENVISARSIGMHGIVFTGIDDLKEKFEGLFRD
jgi:HAD superfamily hydrolase (TIGR01509 family)